MSKLTQGENDLYTWCLQNGEYGQQLISEWTGQGEDGNQYEMNKVTKGIHTKMLWKCKKGHEWWSLIYHRIIGRCCPKCHNEIRSELGVKSHTKIGKNDLYTWCLNNGEYGQQLISEWTGQCDNKKDYIINNISYCSTRNMLWICKKGHHWYADIHTRTRMVGCPFCSKVGTSYPEQFLYRALKQIYPQTISRGKYQGIEYDITIPEERTCIEYSGVFWHTEKLERDQRKLDICNEHNIKFIQIYSHNGVIDEGDIFTDDLIIYRMSNNSDTHNAQLIIILDYILRLFHHNISEIDIEKAQTEAFNFMHNIEGNQE